MKTVILKTRDRKQTESSTYTEVSTNKTKTVDNDLGGNYMKTLFYNLAKLDCGLNQNPTVGPSRVRALPLGVAAERSVHYIWYYFSSFLLSVPHTFIPEGVVLWL